MAVIKLSIDRRSKGEMKRIVVSVNIDSKREYIQTGRKVLEPFWLDKEGKIQDYNGRDKVAWEDNHYITLMLEEVIALYREYEYLGRSITARELKEEYLTRKGKEPKPRQKADGLVKCITEYMDNCEAKNTKDTYKYLIVMLNKFYDDCFLGKKIDNALLKDINKEWIEKFDKYMARTNKKNGRNVKHRSLRAVLNKAVHKGMLNRNPYKDFDVRNDETLHRTLDIDVLRKFYTMELKYDGQRKYRDLFFLQLFMMGLNTVDLLKAKWSDVNNGRLLYIRSKTHQAFSVKITAECQEIIERHKGDDYIIADGGRNPNTFNTNLKEAFRKISLVFPELDRVTSYYSRHSFATIAVGLDIPIDIVGKSLGHSVSSNKNTETYIKWYQKKIDAAQRKVIDCILGKIDIEEID